ncbi:MAG: hypothetical protein IJ587_04530 [Synergistaceae bacterium]|nr:hypothetical protein [Synergistaceae bacterium]
MCRRLRRLTAALLLVLVIGGIAWAYDVVVTASGKKYHKPTCKMVKQVSRTLNVRDAKRLGYTPCKVCKP